MFLTIWYVILISAINPIFWLATVLILFSLYKKVRWSIRASSLQAGAMLMMLHCIVLFSALGQH